MMQKHISEVISFAGHHLIHEQIIIKIFPQFINIHLGISSYNAEYSYSDLILNMCYFTFCGGNCDEYVNYVTRKMKYLKGMKTKNSEKFVIDFYNGRGSSERLFDIQNNDFNWKKYHSVSWSKTPFILS